MFKADYRRVKEVNGMDSYFFVRFLRMLVRIFLPIWLISWVVLLPLTSVGTGISGHSGLDRFTFGNVASNTQSRYAAHLILAWGFTSAFLLSSFPIKVHRTDRLVENGRYSLDLV